jgi:hypothetical protein
MKPTASQTVADTHDTPPSRAFDLTGPGSVRHVPAADAGPATTNTIATPSGAA